MKIQEDAHAHREICWLIQKIPNWLKSVNVNGNQTFLDATALKSSKSTIGSTALPAKTPAHKTVSRTAESATNALISAKIVLATVTLSNTSSAKLAYQDTS